MKGVEIQTTGPLFDHLLAVDELPAFLDVVGEDHLLVDHLGDLLDDLLSLSGFLRERLVAGAASRSVGLVQLTTPDTLLHARAVVGLVDVDAVGGRDRAVVGVAEGGDVASGLVGATNPAVMVFEEGLVDVLAGEVGRRGLPEASRDGLGRRPHVGLVREALQRVSDVVPADSLGRVESGPEVVLLAAWMPLKPVADVRDGFDDGRRARPVLAVLDGDTESVLALGDVLDSKLVQLRRTRAEVPAERDERFVPDVFGGLDHGLDVVVPAEHLGGVGSRVVVAGVASRDPLEALGRLVNAESSPSERAETLPVSSVGLLVLVRLVDPADDVLGGVAIFERVGKSSHFPSHFDASHEDVTMVTRGDFAAADEHHVLVRVEDSLSVGFAHSIAVLAPLDVPTDRGIRLVRHNTVDSLRPCKHRVRSPPRPLIILLTWPQSQPVTGQSAVSHSVSETGGVAA